MEELITTKELCNMLGISENTALNWRKKEGMPFIKVTRKTIKYNKTEVWNWYNRNKVNKKS